MPPPGAPEGADTDSMVMFDLYNGWVEDVLEVDLADDFNWHRSQTMDENGRKPMQRLLSVGEYLRAPRMPSP